MTDDALRHLHRLLVRALRERDPGAVTKPFTVAEIYQDLVPYRSYRDVLGVDMNGDYEHLLLRLLAGEGDLVRLQSKPALTQVRKELDASNPNTGVYREYAAADVRLVEESLPEDDGPVEPAGPEDEAPPPDEGDDTMDAEDDRARDDGETAASGACAWCGEDLPDRPGLKFCPFCGKDVRVAPCPSCGETLEPEWRYCIACGEEVETG